MSETLLLEVIELRKIIESIQRQLRLHREEIEQLKADFKTEKKRLDEVSKWWK